MTPKMVNHLTALIFVKASAGLTTTRPGDLTSARNLCIAASDLCVRDMPSLVSCEKHVATLTALIGS